MERFDKECPRCHGKGIAKPVSAPDTTGPASFSNTTNFNTTNFRKATTDGPISGCQSTSCQSCGFRCRERRCLVENPGWGPVPVGLRSLGPLVFSSWEATGDVRGLRWWIAIPYSIGGKWPIIVVLALRGLAGIVFGIIEYRQQRQAVSEAV